ncbi:Aste57867_11106 [Aphanomyces stellatus]|uniref:Aste57867_11106 protein n=1 Tax=Aphanomyces stellatus TaxID=120398 RepID=A0A485KS66_9STRA|nr:hypothetical protein As57867_011064 [Aphanomyces stellatus]VFT87973.1 Aste57867_11106 [Aphanomyces stellatus]
MVRGRNWSMEEDMALMRAVVQASHRGSDSMKNFWVDVLGEFNQISQVFPRSACAMDNRFKSLRADLLLFVECYADAMSEAQPGASDEDCVAAAMLQFANTNDRVFIYRDLWEDLRETVPDYEKAILDPKILFMKKEFTHVLHDGRTATAMPVQPVKSAKPKRGKRLPRRFDDDDDGSALGRGEAAAEAEGTSKRTKRQAATATKKDMAPAEVTMAASPRHRATQQEIHLESRHEIDPHGDKDDKEEDEEEHAAGMPAASTWRASMVAAFVKTAERQNALLAEQNEIAIFSKHDDAMSQSYFDLKRRIALAKLQREAAGLGIH